jgi:hypothetical protein
MDEPMIVAIPLELGKTRPLAENMHLDAYMPTVDRWFKDPPPLHMQNHHPRRSGHHFRFFFHPQTSDQEAIRWFPTWIAMPLFKSWKGNVVVLVTNDIGEVQHFTESDWVPLAQCIQMYVLRFCDTVSYYFVGCPNS